MRYEFSCLCSSAVSCFDPMNQSLARSRRLCVSLGKSFVSNETRCSLPCMIEPNGDVTISRIAKDPALHRSCSVDPPVTKHGPGSRCMYFLCLPPFLGHEQMDLDSPRKGSMIKKVTLISTIGVRVHGFHGTRRAALFTPRPPLACRAFPFFFEFSASFPAHGPQGKGNEPQEFDPK